MNTQTFLLMVLAALIALGIVLFQYYYKTKKKYRLNLLLSCLRFIAIFGGLLLLINPKFEKNEYRTEKTNLILLVDNSTSVAEYKKDIKTVTENLGESSEINERFNLEKYSFGTSLGISDSLSFADKNTDIADALSNLKEIYSASNSTLLLLSDGNQTLGQDYSFFGENLDFTVYPVAIGDTTRYEDLSIDRINTNRYAFLKNKYPIECFVSYTGTAKATVPIIISVNGKTVFRKEISFSETDNTEVINTLLDANTVGIKNVRVSVGNLVGERNTINNQRKVAVEVIDEKTNVAIISNMIHPDIGAFKKAVERNEQRAVTIKKANTNVKQLEDVNLFVLYQPDASFKPVYDYIQQKKANVFTITGTNTDWNFLNRVQKKFSKNSYAQPEEIFPLLNSGFGLFSSKDFSIQDFPPLENNLGEIVMNISNETLLYQRIKGVELEEPLLTLFENDLQREAVLFGENSWKWRMQSFRNEGNFKNFDDFIGQLILFLTTNKSRERFTLDYKSVFTGSNEAKISATYFDETFVFDANAVIDIKIKKKDSGNVREMPMLLKGGYYESDLSNLPAGEYVFTANVKDKNLSKSGSFTILDFDVEKQFSSTDHQKLERLAQNTGGKLFFPSQTDEIIETFLTDNRFLPTQKSKQNVVSLIDFRILLGLIAFALAAEWFIRKYNGLL